MLKPLQTNAGTVHEYRAQAWTSNTTWLVGSRDTQLTVLLIMGYGSRPNNYRTSNAKKEGNAMKQLSKTS